MGMSRPIAGQVRAVRRPCSSSRRRPSDITGGIGAAVSTMRMILQSAVLGVGAYLVIQQEVSAGVIIAASIIAGVRLRPVDQASPTGRASSPPARAASASTRFSPLCRRSRRMPLPPPRSSLAVERLTAAAPENGRVVAARHQLRARGGQRRRRHRPQRLGQVAPRARARRRLAAGARGHPARRRCARPMAARRARPPCRLPAAGRRAHRGHDRREHRPLRSCGPGRAMSSRRHGRPACTT